MPFPFTDLKNIGISPLAKAICPVRVDLNAHILPGLTDTTPLLSDSITMARLLVKLGISKVIATPLISPGFYYKAQTAFCSLDSELRRLRIPLSLEMSANYHITPRLVTYIQSGGALHTFGAKGHRPYLLLHTEPFQEPAELEEVIDTLNKRKITPLLAHPEHYRYLQKNFDRAIELFRIGARFQVNWQSIHQPEDEAVQKLTEKLIDYRIVSFLASNLSKDTKIPQLIEASQTSHFQLMTETGLINNKLA